MRVLDSCSYEIAIAKSSEHVFNVAPDPDGPGDVIMALLARRLQLVHPGPRTGLACTACSHGLASYSSSVYVYSRTRWRLRPRARVTRTDLDGTSNASPAASKSIVAIAPPLRSSHSWPHIRPESPVAAWKPLSTCPSFFICPSYVMLLFSYYVMSCTHRLS